MIPLTNHLLVELRPPAERSSGGIWLPDNWQENWTDGVVKALGPGLPVSVPSWRGRTPHWTAVGDGVLFPKHAWRELAGREGLLADSDLVACLPPGSKTVEPLNDWVLIEQDAEPPDAGLVIAPELYREKALSGRICDWGAGYRRVSGPLSGTRKDVWQIMGLPKDEPLRDRRVYWDREVELLACGRERLEFLLVRAGDLYAMEALAPEGGGA